MAASIYPCWHLRKNKYIDDISWKSISPFQESYFSLYKHRLPNIKEFRASCDQLQDWELLMHIDYISVQYSDELDDHSTEYFKEVQFLLEKIGHFISSVTLMDDRKSRLRGTSAIFQNLSNLKHLIIIKKDSSLPLELIQINLDREVRDSRSVEMLYSLKMRTSHRCQLKEWTSLLPCFITDQIQRIECGSNSICGLNKVARQLWNIREIDWTIYPGGCKDFFEDLSGFGPNIRKLTIHYIRQCPLVHHMNRFGTLFPSLKEIHLEIKNCQRILTVENWWPNAVFTSVEKIVLELSSQERISDYVSMEIDSPLPLPSLKFLILFPSLKLFHFKFAHGARSDLCADIKNFKAKGFFNDDFKFYDKLLSLIQSRSLSFGMLCQN